MSFMEKKQNFLHGAIILSVGNFSAKIIGAVTRIPLTAFMGAEGIGLYQLAYPFYCLLLTLSSSGLPSGISRMTSKALQSGGDGSGVLKSALKLFFIVGFFAALCMLILRNILSRWQGQGDSLGAGYALLSPAVACVCLLSVFRGWFQGRCDMRPTAATEVIEQGVKGASSIFFAWRYQGDTVKAVTLVLFSVTLSELAALLFMIICYYRVRRTSKYTLGRKPTEQIPRFGQILSGTVPVAIAAAILPLSQVIDSKLCVKLLQHTGEEVALYGLYSGGAVTLVGLPVSVCYGLAASIIPRLHGDDARKKSIKALLLTVAVSLPCALVLFFFSKPIGGLFFRRLSEERLEILSALVKAMALTSITHSCAQTLSASLIGRGRSKRAAINMGIAVSVKILLILLLVSQPQIGIFGMAIAANGCYLTVFVLNLIYNLKK